MNKIIKVDYIEIDLKNIENVTGLDFENATLTDIKQYILRVIENNFKWHNKNLTKKQDFAIDDILEILENINFVE